jgi:hypothetical protein
MDSCGPLAVRVEAAPGLMRVAVTLESRDPKLAGPGARSDLDAAVNARVRKLYAPALEAWRQSAEYAAARHAAARLQAAQGQAERDAAAFNAATVDFEACKADGDGEALLECRRRLRQAQDARDDSLDVLRVLKARADELRDVARLSLDGALEAARQEGYRQTFAARAELRGKAVRYLKERFARQYRVEDLVEAAVGPANAHRSVLADAVRELTDASTDGGG